MAGKEVFGVASLQLERGWWGRDGVEGSPERRVEARDKVDMKWLLYGPNSTTPTLDLDNNISVLEKGGEPKVLENDLVINSEIKVGKKTTRMKLDSIEM